MSIHHMLAHKYFSEMGLKPGMAGTGAVNLLFDVVAPVNMPAFLAENPNACGFMVAEPIGSKAIAAGIAERQLISSEIWDQHPCCVVVFRDEFIERYTDTVHEFTNMLVDSGKFIEQNPDKSSEIAVSFLDPDKKLGLQTPILMKVLTEEKGIKTNDLFPVMEDLDLIQRFMKEKMDIGSLIDLRGKVIPIIDLRLKLGMESVPYTDRMCIIIVDIASYAGSTKIGITTDAVVEVSDIKESILENTPSFGDKVNTSYILGMAKMKGGVTTLLDIEKVLT